MKNRLNERRKQAHILMFSILKILSIFYKKLVHFDLNYLTNRPSNFWERNFHATSRKGLENQNKSEREPRFII
jgi:hypothetical protein